MINHKTPSNTGIAPGWIFAIVGWIFASVTASTANAQPVVWSDPAGDDTGTGTYRYPGLLALPPGLLDLREISIEKVDNDVVVRATLNRKIPVAPQVRLSEDETQDVFYVQVDIYLDLDGNAKNGHDHTVSGRNLAISDGNGWDLAIILTPIANRVRAALKRDPERNLNVHVPHPVSLKGRVLEARLPSALFGNVPIEKWGIVALTTSPTFSTSIEPWVESGAPDTFNIYTREITPNPGICGQWKEDSDGVPCTFGGCSPCMNHPRVLDVLLPAQLDQESLLRAYLPTQLATVPLWYRSVHTRDTTNPPQPTVAESPPASTFRHPLVAILGQSATALATDEHVRGLKPGVFVNLVDQGGGVTGVAIVADIVGQVIILHSTSSISPRTTAFMLRD